MAFKSQAQRKAVMSRYKNKSSSSNQLKKGVKVEREHSRTIRRIRDEKLSTRKAETLIAKDHIKEDPKYYDKLNKAKL